MRKDTIIPQSECPTCHYKMDRATSAYKGDAAKAPCKDDLTCCMKCGSISKFDEKLKMIVLTAEELNDMRVNHPDVYVQIMKLQSVIHAMAKQN